MTAAATHPVDLAARDRGGTAYRMARPHEGPRIGEFMARCPDPNVADHGVSLDWSGHVSGWLLVERLGEIVGCCQIGTTPPVAFADNLMVDPSLDEFTRRRIVVRIVQIGHELFKEAGCKAVVYVVPDERKSLRKALERHGASFALRGAILVRGL